MVAIVPVLVVEIIPDLAKVVLADMLRVKVNAKAVEVIFFIVLLLVTWNIRGYMVGLEIRLLSLSLSRLNKNRILHWLFSRSVPNWPLAGWRV